ncbi:ewing's tumor-associated antigen 1 [Leptodactylus fuscus]|uniref:ewing's tumor-associated antigen 1 n=1 Tax=Leptodactylus fuscus TaxID=238119 RepID=UPI003F4EE572
MRSRRRPPADRSRQVSEDEDRREQKVSKERDRETPKKSSKRLSRSSKAAAARVSSQTSACAPPRSDREEATDSWSNKRTPQRLPRCKTWTSTINSPSNDAEQQQDIFWDPHSPTTFKLENGKKKLSTNRSTAEISDIVKRIAPKNEKPRSSEASYLGIWIGEDAIPCTPVVARSRSKMPRSRILQTEEELMKLAKQLDNNLVKQKDQGEEQMENSEDEMFSECNAVNNEDGSFLEILPEGDDIAGALKSVSQRSEPQGCSQRSVDQAAEADINALFNSSTQKCSGHLSQGLSDVSISSVKDASGHVRSNAQEDIGQNKKVVCSEKPKISGASCLTPKIPTNTEEGVRNNGKEAESVQSVPSSQDDFEDDWDNDLLADDSFIMQVTQNPELIATPKNTAPPKKMDPTNAHHAGREVKSAAVSSSTFSKINNFKFVPRKVNGSSEGKPSNRSCTNVTSANTCQGNAETFTSPQTQVPLKPHTSAGGQMPKNHIQRLAPASTNTVVKTLQKPGAPAAPQTQAITASKDCGLHDDWDDLNFSDEVLDMFCEADSLFEAKEEAAAVADDDDDLLYQVCDDVERLTQAQESSDVNPKKESPQMPSVTCQALAKLGPNASQQSKTGSHVAASSSFGSYKYNRGVSPTSFSGNCSNIYPNHSLQRSNQTFSRSYSAPSERESKNTVLTSAHSQNPVKAPAASGSGTKPAAPSKYSFTRIKPSQVTAGNWSTSNRLHPQGFVDHRDALVPSNSDNISKRQPSSLKRHLAESTIQSPKVFVSEDRNKKCSMEEIERKKQEALARRKLKARACSSDTALT